MVELRHSFTNSGNSGDLVKPLSVAHVMKTEINSSLLSKEAYKDGHGLLSADLQAKLKELLQIFVFRP
ncbi:MAG: hypothetical protein AAF609_17585 [Cyanobacteria bacterium P01_C01_bin.120]